MLLQVARRLNPSSVARAQLGAEQFAQLIEDFDVVPVWKRAGIDLLTPVAAFQRLSAVWPGAAFLLESVEGGERWGRYSFLGVDPVAILYARGGELSISGDAPLEPAVQEAPLAYVRRLLSTWRSPEIENLPPFHGGIVGYLGYDCVRELERLPDAPPDDLGLPDIALMLARSVVVFDHFQQTAFVVCNVWRERSTEPDRGYASALSRCDDVIEALSVPTGGPGFVIESSDLVEGATDVSDEEFASWVESAKENVFAGDVFQVVPSRRFSLPAPASILNAYRALRILNPSPYMYLLRFPGSGDLPGLDIAGSSPEPLVRVTGDSIVTRPIAGTRPRGATPEEDEAIGQELLSDEKERAEHIMLVDLARNDVGKVAEYGSVAVEELMVVERYSHVMHIVSSVAGRLRPELAAFDALLACFPAGTVSGAPKIRAMELIDQLERTRRGPYAGVVGYFDLSGNLDTCITIRTIVATGGTAYIQAGAGVVADSVPADEARETRHKAQALLQAVAAARAMEEGPRD